MDDRLCAELLAMADDDERVRSELAADGSLFNGYHPRMEPVHVRNARKLEEIIVKNGWPGLNLVGEKGTEAAWRIAQHAISLPVFLRACLQVLHEGAKTGDVPPWQPAYLEDRIRVFEGRLQVYGTQFDVDERGEMNPCPVEEPAGLNARRAAIGLDPIEERIATTRAQARAEYRGPPKNRAEYQRKYLEWLKKVGWRF